MVFTYSLFFKQIESDPICLLYKGFDNLYAINIAFYQVFRKNVTVVIF